MRLAQQTTPRLLLIALFVGEELERDGSARELVMRLEDEAHATPRDEPLQLVAGVDCFPYERFGHFFNRIIGRARLAPQCGAPHKLGAR